MPQPPNPYGTPEGNKRFLQILFFMLLASVGFYWIAQEALVATQEENELGQMAYLFLLPAGAIAAAVIFLRFTRIAPLLQTPSLELEKQIARARFFYILCYTLSEAVALFGFVTRVLGGTIGDVAPFYAVAVGLFLICYPKLPQSSTSGPIG